MTLIAHPAADLFPMFGDDEFQSLVNDIKENGLLDPIYLFDGKILDGRNRYKACTVAGVEPKTVTWVDRGSGPISWVLSKNFQRRDMTKSQKAAVAVEAEALFAIEAKERMAAAGASAAPGRPADKGDQKVDQVRAPQSLDQAGDLLGVNRQYVSDAKKLRETAPETYEKVKAGTVTIQEAKREQKRVARRDELAIQFAQKTAPTPTVVGAEVTKAMKLAAVRATTEATLRDLDLCVDATHRVLPDPETFRTCDEGQAKRLDRIASEFDQIARDLRALRGDSK